MLLAGGLAGWWFWSPPQPHLTLTRASFSDLVGWRDDRVSAAILPFLRTCLALSGKADTAATDARPNGLDFGYVGEWRPLCHRAAGLPPHDDAAARQFFETATIPLLAANNGAPEGLFTGYFEITLNGARQRSGVFQTPLYRRPPEPGRFNRGEIEDGALAGQGLELLWVDSPVDAFFLEIQGSGLVRLPKGQIVRVGYDGANGKTYVPVGRLLLDRREIPREQLTMQAIHVWMEAHPKEGAALRRENPSYVFFRELKGEGPLGAEQVPLTPERSLAVDRRFLPLGVPLWLDARQRFGNDEIRRLVIAQDTGGAIRGPVRGDLFWGNGDHAAAGAGAMNARGHYYLLLPHSVAERLLGNAAH